MGEQAGVWALQTSAPSQQCRNSYHQRRPSSSALTVADGRMRGACSKTTIRWSYFPSEQQATCESPIWASPSCLHSLPRRAPLSVQSLTLSGWIGSLQYMLIYLPALPMGRLVDRGLFLWPFWIAAILYPVSIILTAEVSMNPLQSPATSFPQLTRR